MACDSKKEDTKVIIAFVALCLFWGSTYIAIRIGVNEFPPLLFAGIRFAIAGLLVLAFARLKGYKFPDKIRDTAKISIVGLFLLLGSNGLLVWAEQWVHSGVSSLIMATIPLFMAILETILPGGGNLGYKGWIGLLMGFGGVAVLVLPDRGANGIDIRGGITLLLAAFLWAAGSIYSKTFKPSGSIFGAIGIQMAAGGLGLCIAGSLLGEIPMIRVTLKGIGAMIYLILFGSILGYSCFIYVMQKWPAARASTYAYVNPLVAVMLGALVLGEAVNLWVIAAIVIILGGVLLVQLSRNGKPQTGTDAEA